MTRLNLARERRVFRYRLEKRRATVLILERVRRGERRAAMLRSFERALRAEVVI
jgi:hypothetical protein